MIDAYMLVMLALMGYNLVMTLLAIGNTSLRPWIRGLAIIVHSNAFMILGILFVINNG